MNEENDQVVIRTDIESENENDASSEPPAKKVNSTSTSSTSMPSRRETSKERKIKEKNVGGSTADEVLTPAVLQELLNKITGGSWHRDSLVPIDRLAINEILLLKRRIAQYDLKESMDVSREINHINHRADIFSDTTQAETRSNEVVLKILFEEIKELKDTMKEELKKLRSVMKRFEATQHLTVGKEIADIRCGRTFRITKVEKVENLSLGVVEEIYKKDSKAKPRKSIIIPDD